MAETAYAAYGAQRNERVRKLKRELFEAFVNYPDGGVYLARTGSLVCHRSLRTKKNREVFKAILEACDPEEEGPKSRFWTKRVFQDAVRGLADDYQLILPKLPGFDMGKWVTEEAKLLQSLAQKAQRNFGRFPSGSSMGTMAAPDELQTVPYNPEDCKNWMRSVAHVL